MVVTFGNLYLGLAEGSINIEYSSVINAIAGAAVAVIGKTVRLDPIGTGPKTTPVGSLLPRVSVVTSIGDPSYGVIVGGQNKGVYDDGFDPGDPISAFEELGIVAAFLGDAVKVCTQGRCLGVVVTRLGEDVKIGDPLTADRLIQNTPFFISLGTLIKASSGDFVIARALQAVPVGTVNDPQVRVAAVNVKREGVLS